MLDPSSSEGLESWLEEELSELEDELLELLDES
jgi:hypothetical protein